MDFLPIPRTRGGRAARARASGGRILVAVALLLPRCSPGGTAGGTALGGADETPHAHFASGHAPVNGISMYYEDHGRRDGVPLVLLHGGGSTIDVTFGRVLLIFAAGRRVIALEEQTLRHPALVRKLVFASSMTKKDGARPEFWGAMRKADFSNMPQPLKDAFLKVNPDAGQLRTMHDKDAARMRSFPDVPDDALRSVRAPTLIVLGDHDIVKPEHGVELARLIPGASLLILPGGHGDYLGELVMTQRATRYPELTVRLIEEFLDTDTILDEKPREQR